MIRVTTVALLALCAALAACDTGQPYVQAGDATSFEVAYGEDVETTWPVARRYCAQYERTPQLLHAGLNIARFACIRP